MAWRTPIFKRRKLPCESLGIDHDVIRLLLAIIAAGETKVDRCVRVSTLAHQQGNEIGEILGWIREKEVAGIASLLGEIGSSNVIRLPQNQKRYRGLITIEGPIERHQYGPDEAKFIVFIAKKGKFGCSRLIIDWSCLLVGNHQDGTAVLYCPLTTLILRPAALNATQVTIIPRK
jgi:hypothetical protein